MQIPPPQSKETNPAVFRFELKTAAITGHPLIAFLQPKKEATMTAILLPSLQHGENISLITLHSNTGHSDATRGSGFGRKCQTSI